MSNINTILNDAEKSCQTTGARLTDKRKKVLTGLLQSSKALSAYELVDYWREEFNESIPPMSVYRILDFLEGENLVHKLKLANKYVACSHISCNHAHEIPQFLICDACGVVKEIGIKKDLINTLEHNVEEAGYKLQSPQLELHCLCQDCANKAA
ncbi:Zinc uptake regulation protein [Zhongshania aliphaticivorans]|uniref:Zinc uptake regulation protein n=1 Tax=Zhongshania aliphaticivorans TaxID=1470434 RepID=A0A5S9MU19_9GAMM|nr:Fur family transcriptional regulator [Zhongshania aliphaticivorans]CAA0080733.1 Zinc uptake regulation protein [Zhongshania aliphaticivorans]CAA0085417.1 Zinc uptake regulation protein [Zhongshania aliphaticivorans]